MMHGGHFGLGAILIAAWWAAASWAQPLEELPSDAPVARVGDLTITADEVLSETIHRYALGAISEMLFQRFLAERCEEAGIVVDPEDLAPGESLHRARFDRLFADEATPTDAEIEAVYEGEPELYRLEVVPAHGILLEAEADARALLEGGLAEANFEQWARDVSIHESAPDGGDLGELSILSMPGSPEVPRALLQPGEEKLLGPIETDEGWWLLLRGEPRMGPVPPLSEVRELIRDDLRRAALDRMWGSRHVRLRRGMIQIIPFRLWELAGGPPPDVVPKELSEPAEDEETGGDG
jgi:hypothetical protein